MTARTMTATDADARLAKLRADIARVREELTVLDRAPLPLTEATAQLHARIDALATEAPLATLVAPFRTAGAAGERILPPPESRDFTPTLCALLGDVLKVKLGATLAASYRTADGPTPVPLADRAPRRQALRERLRVLEVEEERVILAAEAVGLAPLRREDADVDVVLTTTLAEAGA
jgi:hypothetical protein